VNADGMPSAAYQQARLTELELAVKATDGTRASAVLNSIAGDGYQEWHDKVLAELVAQGHENLLEGCPMTSSFDAVIAAIEGGADTYRKIADVLGVPLDDPDLAADINFMTNLHHLITFDHGCCAAGANVGGLQDLLDEHTFDCRLVLV
jgi:hypothetical protein